MFVVMQTQSHCIDDFVHYIEPRMAILPHAENAELVIKVTLTLSIPSTGQKKQ